jgi:hypothetical protein
VLGTLREGQQLVHRPALLFEALGRSASPTGGYRQIMRLVDAPVAVIPDSL